MSQDGIDRDASPSEWQRLFDEMNAKEEAHRQAITETAKRMAIAAHGDQRYGDKPYAVHLQAVVDWLRRFGFCDHDIVRAAWLHDTLEDTTLAASKISQAFGPDVLHIVECVMSEPGRSRRERNPKTYLKLKRGPWQARAVKLADRIANVSAGGLTDMYRKEWPEFEAAIRGDKFAPNLEPMWETLDRLLRVTH
jgi:(p)ppGpp synthase/HD superfamily hydrolase